MYPISVKPGFVETSHFVVSYSDRKMPVGGLLGLTGCGKLHPVFKTLS